jgi:hypothetical protein
MMDSHECTTERQPGSAYDGAVLLSELTRPAHVPYRCLLPPNLDNLLVPVCLSATHVGWGTIRVEPTWMHIAESAAWACVIAGRRGVAPANVDVAELQRTLVTRGVMLAFFNEFDMSCAAPWVEAVQFFGPRGFFPSYDARPLEPLDPDTADIWLGATREARSGQLDPLALARKLAALPSRPGRTTTVAEFRQRLQGLLPRGEGERELPDSGLKDGGEPLARGDACRLLFHAAGSPELARPE